MDHAAGDVPLSPATLTFSEFRKRDNESTSQKKANGFLLIMVAGSLVQPRNFSPFRAEILEQDQRRFPTLACETEDGSRISEIHVGLITVQRRTHKVRA
jgi:hypothetical protein